jgi:hypothetical protein
LEVSGVTPAKRIWKRGEIGARWVEWRMAEPKNRSMTASEAIRSGHGKRDEQATPHSDTKHTFKTARLLGENDYPEKNEKNGDTH